jgi:hypothetical protein
MIPQQLEVSAGLLSDDVALRVPQYRAVSEKAVATC